MADYMAATIKVGGKLTDRKALVEAILADGPCLDDFDNPSPEVSEVEGAIEEAIENGEVLHLYDSEARYGHFEEIEEACVTLGLSFEVHTSAKYEYDCTYSWWAPGLPRDLWCHAAENGRVLIPAGKVEEALSGGVEAVRGLLKRLTPPTLPPLERA